MYLVFFQAGTFFRQIGFELGVWGQSVLHISDPFYQLLVQTIKVVPVGQGRLQVTFHLHTQTATQSMLLLLILRPAFIVKTKPSWGVHIIRTKARLFPRLQIRCFSCSLAELFFAPHAHRSALSVESRSVAALVSTSRLPSHFPLGWIATCVVVYTLWGASGESGPILREGFL